MADRDPLEWLELCALDAPYNSIVRGRNAEALVAVGRELVAVARAVRSLDERWPHGTRRFAPDLGDTLDALDARLRAEMGER